MLGEFLLCWVSYSIVSKPSYVINWWVIPAGDGRKIDEVGNTVMYPLLPQNTEVEIITPGCHQSCFQVCLCFHYVVNVSYKKYK